MSTLSAEQKKQWQEHMEAYQLSGLSRRRYCRQVNIAYHQFQYYWKQYCKNKKISKRSESTSVKRFSPLKIIPTTGIESRLEVRFPNGITCFISSEFDSGLIKTLIKAMAL
jgi:uncharacterized protein (DUF2236 family)